MDRETVRQQLESAVGEWRDHRASGPLSLDEGTRPVTGVEGFDSYSGIIATIQIEAELGVTFESDNIFLTEDGKRARRVSEILDTILENTKA